MARKRMIHPEFFKSRTVASLPIRARLTFAGLWIYVDDEGRGRDDAALVKAEVWPLDDDVTSADVAEDLTALNVAGLLRRYEKNGLKCLVITNWKEHQRISHPTKSKLPRPPALSRKAPEQLAMLSEEPLPRVVKGSSVQKREVQGPAAAKGNGRVPHEDPTPQTRSGGLARVDTSDLVSRAEAMAKKSKRREATA